VGALSHTLLSDDGSEVVQAVGSWSNSSGDTEIQLIGAGGYSVQVEEDELFVYLVGLKPGRHRVHFEHTPLADKVPLQVSPSKWDPNNTEFAYAATLHGIDTTTAGSWVGEYGSKGYVLFNYSATNQDVVKDDPRIKHVYAMSTYPTNGGPPYPANTPARPQCPSRSSASASVLTASTDVGGGSGYCCAELWNASTDPAVLEPPAGSSLVCLESVRHLVSVKHVWTYPACVAISIDWT
jgi:hypothetical protein